MYHFHICNGKLAIRCRGVLWDDVSHVCCVCFESKPLYSWSMSNLIDYWNWWCFWSTFQSCDNDCVYAKERLSIGQLSIQDILSLFPCLICRCNYWSCIGMGMTWTNLWNRHKWRFQYSLASIRWNIWNFCASAFDHDDWWTEIDFQTITWAWMRNGIVSYWEVDGLYKWWGV
jgi:hypothetical protein